MKDYRVCPRALVYNSTNYCAIRGYGYGHQGTIVIVIDGATNQVIKIIAVGTGPYALVYNQTNNKIYFVNSFSNTVSVIGIRPRK